MKKNNILKNVGILALGLFTLASCSNDDSDGNNGISEGTAHKKFFVATSDAESKASYLLAVDDLESGTVTIKGQGIENPYAFSAFISNGTRTITAMQYRQGDPSVGLSYGLNSDGKLVKAGGEFQLPKGYGTWGTFGDYAIASRSGQTLSIGEGKTATGAIFYFIDQKNKNAVSERTIVTDNIAGNGQTATFCGIVDIGNGEFLTSLVLAKGALSGGGGATTATVEYPDSVWIAKMDINLNVKHIYRDDRISYSSGRFRSSYIPQIGNDDKGNTYVFSGSYESKTKRPAGAIRINKGESKFAPDYYFDIQSASGGYRFRKVWHITEDYFLLEFYNTVEYENMTPATQYAVVKMESKQLTWLTKGFPSKGDITETGTPFAYNGKLYFPVTTATASPTIYVIDPKTATAKAGLVVEAAKVSAVSLLTY